VIRSKPLVVHILPDGHPFGGTEHTVLDLMRSPYLADFDQRVAFVGSAANAAFPPGRVLGREASTAAGRLRAVASHRPALIHGWLLKGNVAGALLRTGLRSSVLITSERNLGHTLNAPKRMLERCVALMEDVATANSTAVLEAATERVPRRAELFRLIPPGVAPPPRPEATERSSCVMVGRLHWVKDHATAIRAWATVTRARPDASLTVVGDGPERQRLDRLTAELCLSSSVRFVGDTDPAPYLYGADLYLSTSIAEGFSRATLEAMAVGLPVVSTNVGGSRDLPPGSAVLLDRANSEGFAKEILKLLSDSDRRERASRAAADASTRFSVQACHTAYRDLYHEALQGGEYDSTPTPAGEGR
jgi:glycosyltransferase involved in cell wall biosynthesis